MYAAGSRLASSGCSSTVRRTVSLKRRIEWMVHEGMITFPLARLAAFVREDPRLQIRYGPAADRYVRFIEDHIVPKWERYFRRLGADAGTYVFPGEPAYGWAGNSQPHNQVLALGRTFIHLYRATGNPGHLSRAEELGRAFKQELRAVGTTYQWTPGARCS